MTVAQAASYRWDDIKVNIPMPKAIRDVRTFIDGDALVAEGRQILAAIAEAVSAAPSVQAWCDNTYALYGPNGTMIRCLQLR